MSKIAPNFDKPNRFWFKQKTTLNFGQNDPNDNETK